MDSWSTRAGLRAFQSSPGTSPAHSRAKNQALGCPDNPTACVLGSFSKGTAETVVPNVTGQLEQHMDVGPGGSVVALSVRAGLPSTLCGGGWQRAAVAF